MLKEPNKLSPNESLNTGGSIFSLNQKYQLNFQIEGGLALYALNADGSKQTLWEFKYSGQPSKCLTMQNDGNLVIIREQGVLQPNNEFSYYSVPVWSTSTMNNPGSYLIVQDDGNLVIYKPDNTPIWSTGTAQVARPVIAPQGDKLRPYEILHPGQSIFSANKRYELAFLIEGNLVLSKHFHNGSKTLWRTTTSSGTYCVMQGDGNLVICDGKNQPLWASNTWNNAGAFLALQDDGNLVIYKPSGEHVWATNTVQKMLPTGNAPVGNMMQPGEVLLPNSSLFSTNKKFELKFQNDGNLVIIKHRDDGTFAILWTSPINPLGGFGGLFSLLTPRVGEICVMQGDGNLVIYDMDVNALWSSNTYQYPGSHLQLLDNGNLGIFKPDNTKFWETNIIDSTNLKSELDKNINGDIDWQMKTVASLSEDGTLYATTELWSRAFLSGFHGAVVITVTDINGTIIFRTDKHSFGVGALGYRRNEWQEKMPVESVPKAVQLSISEFYDPHSIFGKIMLESEGKINTQADFDGAIAKIAEELIANPTIAIENR